MQTKPINLFNLALTVLVFTGCSVFQTSTTQNLPAVGAENPPADKALIIVDGTDSFGGIYKLYAAAMYDNETFVGKVGPHGRLAWLRAPGLMELSLNHSIGKAVTVVAGEKYHYKLNCGSSLIYSIDDLMTLEGLLTVPVTANNQSDFLQAIASSQNLITLQQTFNHTSDREIKTAAQSRLATVVSITANLAALVAIRGEVKNPDLEKCIEQRLTYLKEELSKAEIARKQRVAQNWPKLQAGLTIDEVDQLVGPLDAGWKQLVVDLRNASANLSSKTSSDLSYQGDLYVLKFKDYRLSFWQLRQPNI